MSPPFRNCSVGSLATSHVSQCQMQPIDLTLKSTHCDAGPTAQVWMRIPTIEPTQRCDADDRLIDVGAIDNGS